MGRTARQATTDRRAVLLRLLRGGTTRVDQLAEALTVSASTVRRDLDHLTSEGLIARTYGGALVPETFHERSLHESELVHLDAKASIAREARHMIGDEVAVFIDAGTTCGALARLLAGTDPAAKLSVVTRGLETATTLAAAPDIAVTILGGRIRSLSHGTVGPLTDLALDRFSFDVAFLGADAVDPARGVGEPTLEETTVKERIAARSQQTVVLADSSKLHAPTPPAWAQLGSGWVLVTDAEAPSDLDRRCADSAVTLVRAD